MLWYRSTESEKIHKAIHATRLVRQFAICTVGGQCFNTITAHQRHMQRFACLEPGDVFQSVSILPKRDGIVFRTVHARTVLLWAFGVPLTGDGGWGRTYVAGFRGEAPSPAVVGEYVHWGHGHRRIGWEGSGKNPQSLELKYGTPHTPFQHSRIAFMGALGRHAGPCNGGDGHLFTVFHFSAYLFFFGNSALKISVLPRKGVPQSNRRGACEHVCL